MSELLDLNWNVFVTPGIPSVTSDLPPGSKQRLWPPMSSTLISGKRDAVLVDAFITVEQAGALVDWVVARGKNLTTTARELYDKMLELYPDRINPGALWSSARAVKP
jgi:hypothetical protein